MNNNAPRY